jgi:hypothetical protein
LELVFLGLHTTLLNLILQEVVIGGLQVTIENLVLLAATDLMHSGIHHGIVFEVIELGSSRRIFH